MNRNLFVICCLALMMYGCENVQRNDPAFQGVLDEELFRAIDSRATKNEDGSYLIQGVTQRELLTLKISSAVEQTYTLGGLSENYATFEDFNGNIYSTNPNGGGEIVISKWDRQAKRLSGTFKFKAIVEGLDTLVVQKGAFLEVPYDKIIDVNSIAGTFVARVDGEDYNPFTITAVATGNSINIKGNTPNTSIRVRVPQNVMNGDYLLPRPDFNLSYTKGNISEEANTGNVTITSHDANAKIIKGAFFFITDNHTISLGQFNVEYQ